MSALVNAMYELNDIDFNLRLAGVPLDMQWPLDRDSQSSEPSTQPPSGQPAQQERQQLREATESQPSMASALTAVEDGNSEPKRDWAAYAQRLEQELETARQQLAEANAAVEELERGRADAEVAWRQCTTNQRDEIAQLQSALRAAQASHQPVAAVATDASLPMPTVQSDGAADADRGTACEVAILRGRLMDNRMAIDQANETRVAAENRAADAVAELEQARASLVSTEAAVAEMRLKLQEAEVSLGLARTDMECMKREHDLTIAALKQRLLAMPPHEAAARSDEGRTAPDVTLERLQAELAAAREGLVRAQETSRRQWDVVFSAAQQHAEGLVQQLADLTMRFDTQRAELDTIRCERDSLLRQLQHVQSSVADMLTQSAYIIAPSSDEADAPCSTAEGLFASIEALRWELRDMRSMQSPCAGATASAEAMSRSSDAADEPVAAAMANEDLALDSNSSPPAIGRANGQQHQMALSEAQLAPAQHEQEPVLLRAQLEERERLSANLTALQQALASAREEHERNMQASMTSLKDEFAEQQRRWEAEMKTLQDRLADTEAVIRDQSERLVQADHALASEQAAAVAVKEQHSSLQATWSATQTELSRVSAALRESEQILEAERAERCRAETSLRDALEQERATREALQLRNSQLEQELAKQGAAIAAAERAMAEAEATAQTTHAQLRVAHERELHRVRAEAEQQVAHLRADTRANDDRLAVMRETIEQMRRQLQTAQDVRVRAEEALASVRESSDSQQRKAAQLLELAERDLAALKEELIRVTRDKQALWLNADQAKEQLRHRISSTWSEDANVMHCRECGAPFSLLLRRHHCRMCGGIFCYACSNNWVMTAFSNRPVRVCKACNEVAAQTRFGARESSSVTQISADDDSIATHEPATRTVHAERGGGADDEATAAASRGTATSAADATGSASAAVRAIASSDAPAGRNGADGTVDRPQPEQQHVESQQAASAQSADRNADDDSTTDVGPGSAGDSDRAASGSSQQASPVVVVMDEPPTVDDMGGNCEVCQVKAGRAFEVPLTVETAGVVMIWAFRTQPKNIAYAPRRRARAQIARRATN